MTGNNHVDLAYLQNITRGNSALEEKLFEAFLNTSDACYRKLQSAITQQVDEGWYASAHEWKGACLSIGAYPLAELCKMAEQTHPSKQEKGFALLGDISRELADVRAALQTYLAAKTT